MAKAEASDLQTTVNGILAQALGERSEIGGAMNWADLRCVDVEISLLDGHVPRWMVVSQQAAAADGR